MSDENARVQECQRVPGTVSGVRERVENKMPAGSCLLCKTMLCGAKAAKVENLDRRSNRCAHMSMPRGVEGRGVPAGVGEQASVVDMSAGVSRKLATAVVP